MKKYSKYISFLPKILLLAALIPIVKISLSYPLNRSEKGAATEITRVKYSTDAGDFGTLELPTIIEMPAPRTGVTLTTEIEAGSGEAILVKSVFSPMKVFVNEELALEYGQAGSYPTFMNDPPTASIFVPLPSEGGKLSLRISYESPTQRKRITLPTIYMGTTGALLEKKFTQNAFTFSFSIVLIVAGFFTFVVTLGYVGKISASNAFLRLGLSSLLAGVWGFGECDLTVLLFPYPVLLYAMSYLGLFLLVFSVLRFGLLVVQPKNKLPMQAMLWVHGVSIFVSIILQLTGRIDFTKSLYWFQLIITLSFVISVVFLLWEWLLNKNMVAKQFIPSLVVLFVFTIIGLINYYLNFTEILPIFYVGILFFMITLGFISGSYVQDSMKIVAEKEHLEHQVQEINHQLEIQRMHYQRIADNEAMIKAQRHDLRHQLTVLKVLYGQNDKDKFERYLDILNKKLPSEREPLLCENYAVNAIASHYAEMARLAGADVSVSLMVPQKLPADVESDLCVIIGNLMENAAEACARMTGDDRFVHVNSVLQYGVLTIVVDNSFEGKLRKKEEGVYFSSKRDEEGIGLTSVTAVARKYDGNAYFEEKDGIFQASVYARIA
ncbi:MAG: GHKL domain-containing protein [Clostridiaceae bacterium]|jgi:hypothetical protein|nr:GHKL domain-containing protein [Clostridiaceae bacterium]